MAFSYTHHHRVRYRECDPMGVVYHGHYIDYFEYARTEALRDLGMPYKSLEDRGYSLPVIDLGVQYKRSAFYDDHLAITALIDEPPVVRLTIRYEVRRVDEDDLLTTGHVTLCFIDQARERPVPVPADVRALFPS